MDKYINQIISDRYEIKEIIGVGGMAKVYKAYDRVDDRIVAVKILKEEYIANEEYRVRFKNESRAISLLNHLNVVKVYDVCFSDDIQYIVMEHVEGITLKEFIEKQKVLDWKEALIVVVQILRALQHAHDKGVIHRDIKPQNILLLSNATIKVTDFGIASFKRGELSSLEDNEAIGSVHYVSPEQARGDYTDEKSDIYSVGVVLYEMLTGKIPFESDREENVALMQVQEEAVRPTAINSSIPLGLEQITLRAMQKNASDRYHSAAEFLMDLDEFRKNPEIIFDYHYFIDKTPTKFISSKPDFKKDMAPVLIDDEYDEDDEYIDDDEDDDDTSRSSALPVLIGVAIALVLVVALIVFGVFGSTIKDFIFGESSSQSDDGSFLDKIDIFGWFSKDDIEVPHFINMKFDEVLEKYPELAIETPPQYEYNSTYDDGYVCNQYPEAGDKVSKDTVFKLTVATSGESVLIQDVSGKSSIQAESILRASGLVVEMIPLSDDTRDEGEVIYTKPSANTYTPYKSTVYVYYATGKNTIDTVNVPNVVGYELEAAKQKIINAGLKVGAVTQGASTPSMEGFVISQTPDSSTPVNSGMNVNLVIGNGIPATNTAVFTISLPSLGAGSISTIKTYLNDTPYDSISGVSLNGESYQLSFTGSGNENSFKIYCDAVLIYTGDIDFTTTPPTFSNVHGYQFSTKESVPNVVGLSESEAEAALSAAGFNRVKITTEASATVPEGFVISQSPIYSETAKYSTATIVTIVISEGAVAVVPPEGESVTNEAPSVEETTGSSNTGENVTDAVNPDETTAGPTSSEVPVV
ncbi:MAG: Stk1 family PASTA domain-containing Ser/Thr kinase [Clostridia bacterium]|nr:Stk1 family PASTA domain-containing Ser/Thr kinase [Clostridia bacterium]